MVLTNQNYNIFHLLAFATETDTVSLIITSVSRLFSSEPKACSWQFCSVDVQNWDWLPPVPHLQAQQASPRKVAWWVTSPAPHRILLTRPTDRSGEIRCPFLPQSLSKSTWSDSVLATEAIKAGIASKAMHLSPRPPTLTGKLAWTHWLSVKLELVMCWIEHLKSTSNFSSEVWETEEEHLKRWRTFVALKAEFKRIKPSWQPMAPSLSTALASSSHRLSQDLAQLSQQAIRLWSYSHLAS